MSAYYNEIDPYAAAWLRRLIAAGHIADGIVDERSIEDIHPAELREFTQCHFFAGIGVWSRALRLAHWPDERRVWTGSCPCQPFSAAGKGAGFADERHLWPAFNHLIAECRPPVVFGEQVASKDGLQWLDLVRTDLEVSQYAVGVADLCAAGVGAPHIRQRLWWVADAEYHEQREGRRPRSEDSAGDESRSESCGRGDAGGLDNNNNTGLEGLKRVMAQPQVYRDWGSEYRRSVGQRAGHQATRPSPTHGHWGDADWLFCRDGKWRPVEPGTFPLVDGAPSRVGRLRAYGNAIVCQVAEVFIRAVLGE
jgi:DNA (cytosine-5)-methyltransferase 1